MATIEDWEAEHSEIYGEQSPWYGALPKVQRDLVNDIQWYVEEADSLMVLGDHKIGGDWAIAQWSARHAAVELTATHKWTLHRVAEETGLPLERIARLYCQSPDDVPTLIRAHDLAHSPEWDQTTNSIADATGWTQDRVRDVLGRLGIETAAARSKAAGGGYKYGPEVYATIEAKRKAGLSYTKIAKAVEAEHSVTMASNTIAKMCLRRGWHPVEHPAEAEVVA